MPVRTLGAGATGPFREVEPHEPGHRRVPHRSRPRGWRAPGDTASPGAAAHMAVLAARPAIKHRHKQNTAEEVRLGIEMLASVLTTLATTALLAVAGFLWRQVKGMGYYKKAWKNLMKAEILDICTACHDKGYATQHDRELLADLFESYTDMGGNSFVHDEVLSVKDLPREPRGGAGDGA